MPRHIALLLKLLLLGLLTGQAFRITLLLLHRDQWHDATRAEVITALFDRGLLFDLYVNAWVLVLPAILLSIRYAIGARNPWLVVASRWIWTTLFLIVLFCACSDLPFYAYTNMRLTDLALSTVQTVKQSLKELVSTPPYLLALAVFTVFAVVVVRVTRKWFSMLDGSPSPLPATARWSLLPLLLVPLFAGVRGTWSLDDAPLSAEDAYFSQTPFLNQLGTNAAFSFIESFGQDKVRYIDGEEAIAYARYYLGIDGQPYESPIARDAAYDSSAARMNVVLILVESLSANRLARFGHPKRLMPFLESLMDSSLIHEHFYSAGTRTCNGVFSSLYGLPSIGARHPLAHPEMVAQHFHGLPGVLRDADYSTSFIYPGDAAFDNMGSFLRDNGFERFISERDFADDVPRNSWGVTDHALYGKAIEHLDSLSDANRRPFFATLLTISSHKGYNVPEDIAGFAPTSAESDEGIYEYADRAMESSSRQPGRAHGSRIPSSWSWAHHGQRFDPLHEVPLAYHHVPLILHAPGRIAAGAMSGFGTQVDLPETVLGLLRVPHVNNTLGFDLTRSAQQLAYYCSDHRIAALNNESYWIRTGDTERLYDLRSRSTDDLTAMRPADHDGLKRHAESMVQAAAWLVEKRMAGRPSRSQ
ncbi:MAG: sulfatase-like hydrolase/transferase [Flavobacteriales bacterium]|nr:sulfatase-like hydrolase/transferase [Flavobacteriales bacterium]